MATKTKIEWTDYSWNPVTGCTEADTSCRNCYAKRMAARLAGRNGYPADEPFRLTLHPDRLDEPLRWRKPRRVFVCSMGDLFHKDVPDEFIDQVWAAMIARAQHTFLVLTKRPDRMADYARQWHREYQDHIWMGSSAGTQEMLDRRLPHLLRIPAAVRFLSLEPLLGPIDIPAACVKRRRGDPQPNWVIVGGESGPKARPCDVEWIRSIVQQCKAAGVPCFVKQLGAKATTGPTGNFRTYRGRRQIELAGLGLRDPKGGNMAEWPEDLRVREVPKCASRA